MKKNDYYNGKLVAISQVLRRNMTPEEKHLWYDFLKLLPQTFRRQKPIGPFVVDFYCASAKLVIELDGAQHFTPEERKKDAERDTYLSELGIRVLRYTNVQINQNFQGVCQDILKNMTMQYSNS